MATFAPMRCLEVLHLTGLQRVTGDIAAFGGPNPGVLTSLYLSGTGASVGATRCLLSLSI